MTSAPSSLERLVRDARVSAVRAVDGDAEAAEVAPEALDDVLEVAVGRDADAVDGTGLLRRRRVQQRLDLLLGFIGQLAALGIEELDAVVLRRVVRRRDDGPDVEGEQRHGRRRQHAGEDGVAAGGCDSLSRTPPRARARTRACPSPRTRVHVPTRPLRRGQVSRTRSVVRSSPTTPRTPSVPKYLRAMTGGLYDSTEPRLCCDHFRAPPLRKRLARGNSSL